MFSSVLVANRGEIAVRIIRTLRRMGIRGVVVASIPDRRSLAVRSADASVLLEGYSASETYLDMNAVIAAAKSQGCEAIHPGYGFLSERADFAERCAAEGLVFVGPPPAVLLGVGDKAAARQLAVANDVPVVPGWDGEDDDATLQREAARIRFPVMIKARGGGGGRGMRAVESSADLAGAIASARQEASAAFGDPGLLLERLVVGAHHVEVQVLADQHGNVIHLGERDCSVQRRHQKLVEETPSPVVDSELRGRLTDAALRLARAVGYQNAGTFEFLVGQPGQDGTRPFYFLEVNPRLQVEHPVTEAVTGLDLVELQLRIAAGERLPFRQDEVQFNGHALELRINSEDPRDDFRPSTGRIAGFQLAGGRIDAGFERGDVVPSQYDSLLAKVIVCGRDRVAAVTAAREALSKSAITGLRTNIGLQRAIVASPRFGAGEATVDWLEPARPALLAANTPPPASWAAAAAAISATGGATPFDSLGWTGAGDAQFWLDSGEETRSVRIRRIAPQEWVVIVGGQTLQCRAQRAGADRLSVVVGEGQAEVEVAPSSESRRLRVTSRSDDASWMFSTVPPPPLPRRAHVAADGVAVVTSPLAGTIATVRVVSGAAVEPGEVLATLEAMKMEHRVAATAAGTVNAVLVAAGDVVREGDVLFELE